MADRPAAPSRRIWRGLAWGRLNPAVRCAARSAPAAVGAYIGAAYWFTSSTSFANPAITIGRIFSATFAGIAASSAPAFIGAQIAGGLLAVVIIKALYPAITPANAVGIIVPHHDHASQARAAHDGASPSADRPR